METVFIYIIKSSGLILLFYCVYFFLLRKETFFNKSRWFLLSGLLLSAVLPLISYTKEVWIDAVPNLNANFQTTFANVSQKESVDYNWSYLILGLYGIGFLVFFIKLGIDFYSLNSVIKGKKIQQQADFKFIDINENIAPFSYFEYIVYNSSLYTASELESILEHEKVHSDQNHTADVLISRAFSIIFWFNPIIWLYKKAIMQNLEFIADSEAAKKITDKKAYQYTLLKITTHENCIAITNHFYQSLIKKRIVMLNKNQSKRRNSWKYYVVIPALAAFVLLFQVEVIAKEKQQTSKELVSGETKSVDVYKIKKSSTDQDLENIKSNLKSKHNIDFKVSEIKRDAQKNLTSIKVDIKNGTQQTKSIQTEGDEPIKDFGIVVIVDQNGNKKVGIQTEDAEGKIAISKKVSSNSDTKKPKTEVSKSITTNTKTNVNTNSTTSTKTDCNTSTTVSTIVTTNTDNNNVTKVTTKNGASTITFSNATKNKGQITHPLVIINGEEMPLDFDFKNDIDSKDIESIHVLKDEAHTIKYGEKGKNGVLIIETRK